MRGKGFILPAVLFVIGSGCVSVPADSGMQYEYDGTPPPPPSPPPDFHATVTGRLDGEGLNPTRWFGAEIPVESYIFVKNVSVVARFPGAAVGDRYEVTVLDGMGPLGRAEGMDQVRVDIDRFNTAGVFQVHVLPWYRQVHNQSVVLGLHVEYAPAVLRDYRATELAWSGGVRGEVFIPGGPGMPVKWVEYTLRWDRELATDNLQLAVVDVGCGQGPDLGTARGEPLAVDWSELVLNITDFDTSCEESSPILAARVIRVNGPETPTTLDRNTVLGLPVGFRLGVRWQVDFEKCIGCA